MSGFVIRLGRGSAGAARHWVLDEHSVASPGQRSAERDLVVVLDGVITNHATLRRTLGLPAATSDREVIATLWRQLGPAIVGALDGEFALAILDAVTHTLFVATDAIGIHPMYVATTDDEVWAASDLGALVAALPVEPPIDPVGVAEWIGGRGVVCSSRTPFGGVTQLPRGDARRFTLRSHAPLRVESFAYTPRLEDLSRATETELVARAGELLTTAISGSLTTRGTAWISSSGGLDSSTIAALAKHGHDTGRHATSLRLFTLVFGTNGGSDERVKQAIVRDHLGLPVDEIDLDVFEDYAETCDAYPWAPTELVFRGRYYREQVRLASEHGVSICLNGQGGDQLFGQHLPPWWLHRTVRQGRLAAAGAGAWRLARAKRYSLAALMSDYVLGLTLPCSRTESPWASRMYVDAKHALERTFWTRGLELAGDPAVGLQLQAIRNLMRHPATALPTSRFPLAHRTVVEFFLSLPWHWKDGGDRTRVLQRRMLAPLLPRDITERTTKERASAGFLGALRHHFPKLRHVMRGERLSALGIVVPRELERAVASHRHGNTHASVYNVTQALDAERWLALWETGPRRSHPRFRELQTTFGGS